MEGILRSVLLRQEQMVMQWDAEFEQQKQLFHINTSTLIDLLPIRSRKKCLKVGGRVQPGRILSHDKENLVGFQDFLRQCAQVKCPKAKVSYSRGFAKRDLNTRFFDNDVKDVGPLQSKLAEPPRLQSARQNGLDAENVQLNGRVSRAVSGSNQDSLGLSVKFEVDEGDTRETLGSLAIGELASSPAANRKRIRWGQEENVVLRTGNEEKKDLSNNPQGAWIGTDRVAVVDPAERKSKSKGARVIGMVKENGAVLAKPVQTCRDTLIARYSESEIANKVEVDPEEQTCRDVRAVGFTEPEIASNGPPRRGMHPDVKASGPEIVSKEPARRGRAKKVIPASEAAVPEIAQRVTRSRARKVENVVESVCRTHERMVASEVSSKESVPQRKEVSVLAPANVKDSSGRVRNAEPTHGDSVADCDVEGESRSANQIVEENPEAFCASEVCSPLQARVTRHEPSNQLVAHSKERKSMARSREKYAENQLVACDMEMPGRVYVSSYVDAHVESPSSHSGAEKQSARIGSRVAEILGRIGGASAEISKDGEHESMPESRLERIGEDVGHRQPEFAARVPPLASRCEGTKVPDGSISWSEAPPPEKDSARDAHCSAAPGRVTLIGVAVDRMEGLSQIQAEVAADRTLASNNRAGRPSAAQCLSSGEVASLPLGKDPVLVSDATCIKAVSRASPTNNKVAYTTLLSKVIEGSILPLEKVCGPVLYPEGVVVARPRKSFLLCEKFASAPIALGLPDAGLDASTSTFHDLPSAGMIEKSIVEDGSVDGRDGLGAYSVGDLIALASKGQGTMSDNVIEERSIQANIQFAERSWHTKGESVQDPVVSATSEGSRVKEADYARQSTDGAPMMDTNFQNQVISDAVSPVRYSEARAIEEAMRCSWEQEFHPSITLTLDRWQFRKRLSPRSKARARRWKSDVSAKGVDYGRGQLSDAPGVVPSRGQCMKDVAYETFLESQSRNPETALGGIEPAYISGAEKTVDQADPTTWQEDAPQSVGMARRSIASLRDEVLSQALHDREIGDDTVEYEVMETADEQNGNLSPLVPSIYKLSKTCEYDIVGVDRILEAAEQQQVPNCSDAVRSGYGRLTRTESIRVHLAPDVHSSTIALGTPAICSATPLRGSQSGGDLQSCDGSVLSIGDRIGAVDTVEVVTHQSEVPFSSETMVEPEKLLELRSCFSDLLKDHVAGTSSTAKGVPNLLGARPETSNKHSTEPPSIDPSVRFSAGYVLEQEKGGRVSARTSAHAPMKVDLDSGDNRDPAVVMEGETRILCSPIFIGNERHQVNCHEDDMADDPSFSHYRVQKSVTVKDEVVVLDAISEPSQEAVARTRSMATPSASVLGVELQHPFNLVGAAPSPVPNSSKHSRLNLVSGIRSFIPLVLPQQPAGLYPSGKRNVKVKALEAAEAAKRLAEQKELEKQERKKAAEITKRDKQERAAQEKLAIREKAAQDKLIKQQEPRAEKETEESSKRKVAAAGATKSTMTVSNNYQGTCSQSVLLKMKKTYELKLKMDQDKQESLEDEHRRKEEEWKKKQAENADRKRKHGAAEKKEREEKRRRQEEVLKAHRDIEERHRLEFQKKAQIRKALEEMEKERKATEEELKRQKRLDKEREVEQRRNKEQEQELAWLGQKEVTRKLKKEAAKQIKLLETEGRQPAVKRCRSSEDPSMPATGLCHSFMASLHVAVGFGEGVGGAHLSGVNNLVDLQRVSSHSLVGYPLQVPQQSGEGVGTAFPPSRNSQAAMRVPRATPESAPGMLNIIGGCGKPLFLTPPEALDDSAVASVTGTSGCVSSAGASRGENHASQSQSGSRPGVLAVVKGSKPSQPGQVGFAGPPGGVIGHRDKDIQSYEISPFRDSEDEDSDDEEKRSQKPIPQWARKENMWPQLVRQFQQDPDDIFVGANSCNLDEVFEVKGSRKRPDFKRRGSSGDWAKDYLTWQEQIQYKVAMGYLH